MAPYTGHFTRDNLGCRARSTGAQSTGQRLGSPDAGVGPPLLPFVPLGVLSHNVVPAGRREAGG